jgi:membrane-bound lytic murein transglycosylase B
MTKFPHSFFYTLTFSATLSLIACSPTQEREIRPVEKPKVIAPAVQVEPTPPIEKPILPEMTTPLSINQNVKNFIRQMVTKHHFDERELTQLLQSAVIKNDILKRISSPSEGLPWHKYRKIFLTQARIDGGVKFWQENAQALSSVSQQTGVAPEIIVAIIGVETGYGKNMGNHHVLDALATLAFAYPPRSPFFTGELEQFLLLCREEKKDPREPLGSYAGAMGYPQFMPSSFRSLAKDFEHDGKRDIWQNPRDAIASVGFYFQQNGWQQGQDIAAKATANGSQYKAFVNKDLKLNATVGQLAHTGLNAVQNFPVTTKVKLVALEMLEGEE